VKTNVNFVLKHEIAKNLKVSITSGFELDIFNLSRVKADPIGFQFEYKH